VDFQLANTNLRRRDAYFDAHCASTNLSKSAAISTVRSLS
jgi:hypothetical protein